MHRKNRSTKYIETLPWYRETYPFIIFPENGPDTKNEKFEVVDVDFGPYLTTRKFLESGKRFRHPKRGTRDAVEKARKNESQRRKKIEETCLARYGTKNVFSSKSVREKIKETNRDRYGCAHPMHDPEIVSRMKETYLKNKERNDLLKKEGLKTWSRSVFGTDHPMQDSSYRESLRLKYREKTGFDHPFSDPSFRSRYQSFTSNGEEELRKEIEKMGFHTQKAFNRDISGKFSWEIDIYVPECNLGIEFNGCYWHSDKFIDKYHHLKKTQMAQSHDIRLIHVFESDWIHRRKQVLSFLRSALGKNENRVWARKCSVQLEPLKEVSVFLDENHILGTRKTGDTFVSLRYNGEIVCVAAFGKKHRQNQKEKIFLTRFCSKENVTVVGGLSKIMNFFSRHSEEDIYTFVSRHLSEGESYLVSGWEHVSYSGPDYFYFHVNSDRVYTKQSRMKSKARTPHGMTEAEHASRDGLVRIWDCGKRKLVFKNKISLQKAEQ